MIKWLVGLGLWLFLLSSPAMAQQADQFWNCVPSDVTKWCPTSTTYPLPVAVVGSGTSNYGTSPGAVPVPSVNAFVTNPISATFSGNSGAIAQTAVSVANSSTALLAAAQFSNFEKVCVAQTATTGVWINWANAAAVTAAPSEYVPPGQCDTWVKSTGFLPTAAAFAISNSASTIVVTVEGN